MKKVLYILLLFSLWACKKEVVQNTGISSVKQDSIILGSNDLKDVVYTDYVLDLKANKELSGWVKYYELKNIVEQVKQADLSHFKNDKAIVEASIKDLLETLPDTINNDPVNARVLALKNMYLRLNNVANMSTSTNQDLKASVEDFLVAFSNLNFQINKKFERDAQKIIKP